MRASSKKAKGLGGLRLALVLATVPLGASCAASEERLELAPPAPALTGHGTWLDGQRDGAWTFFYPSGQPLAEGRFEQGRRVGFWRYWYPDQTPFAEGNYDGQVEGLWVLYEPDGSICIGCRSPLPSRDWVCATEIPGEHHFPWHLFSVQQRDELRRDVLPFYAGLWFGSGRYQTGTPVRFIEVEQSMKVERQQSRAQDPTADV